MIYPDPIETNIVAAQGHVTAIRAARLRMRAASFYSNPLSATHLHSSFGNPPRVFISVKAQNVGSPSEWRIVDGSGATVILMPYTLGSYSYVSPIIDIEVSCAIGTQFVLDCPSGSVAAMYTIKWFEGF